MEHTVRGLEGQYCTIPERTTLVEVEKALREHDASRQAIQELFKFAHTESLHIINKIRQQVTFVYHLQGLSKSNLHLVKVWQAERLASLFTHY